MLQVVKGPPRLRGWGCQPRRIVERTGDIVRCRFPLGGTAPSARDAAASRNADAPDQTDSGRGRLLMRGG